MDASSGGQREVDHRQASFGDMEQIYRTNAASLIRFANSLVGPSDAQDVVSSAVLKCMTSRRWNSVENHRAYLYRAVLNEVRSKRRSDMRRQARELRVGSPQNVELPDVRPEVLEALGKLSVRQRAVAYLTYMEDLDEATVAKRLGISTGSVRQHLGRARRKLKVILDA